MTAFAGFFTGLALVMPIGPVSLALIGLGTEHGRRRALAGAAGVVAADCIALPVALMAAGTVGRLPAGAIRATELVLAALLAAVGIWVVRDASAARDVVASIRRPIGTLLTLTLVNPLSLAAWLGLALAMPAGVDGVALAWFGVGIVAASALWHSTIALGAGAMGNALGEAGRLHLARVSGAILLAVAAALVV